MTNNVVSGSPRLDLTKGCVKVIDIIYWVNKTYKPLESKIEVKEFFNDAINENINLDPHLIHWARNAHMRMRNDAKLPGSRTFCLHDYQWLMPLKEKSRMITKYHSLF
jgi:hypothetical protein